MPILTKITKKPSAKKPDTMRVETFTGAVTRVHDEAGNVIATHEQAGEFKEP